MNNSLLKLDSKSFPYLNTDEIQKIKDGFTLLNSYFSEQDCNIARAEDTFKKPSLLTSKGINYTLSGSALSK